MNNDQLNQANSRLISIGYREGLIDGVRRFAWWKDGVQYVGTSRKTLKEAVTEIEQECRNDPNYRQPF
jgi:hypothetical protein